MTDLDQLRTAFQTTFGLEGRPFGSNNSRWIGVSDDAKGVQWNASIDQHGGPAFLGVNLEGMEYDGWPIARFIERELARPMLLDTATQHPNLSGVVMSFMRDAWQAAARLTIEEAQIGGETVRLGDLTPMKWREMLQEAYQCLDANRSHRGRVKQVVTLKSGRVEKWVSPHLHLGFFSGKLTSSPLQAATEMAAARDTLQPLYDVVRKQSA